MRTSLRTALLLTATATATAVVALGGATPAAADTTGATFSLVGGDLTLSVAGTAALDDAGSAVSASTITGSLGAVTVDDGRGGTTGWVASAASTTFGGLGLSTSLDVRYSNGTVTESGTADVASVTAESIMTSTPVATATGVSGGNTASWSPTVAVDMPAGALAGDYAGTVTTSLL